MEIQIRVCPGIRPGIFSKYRYLRFLSVAVRREGKSILNTDSGGGMAPNVVVSAA